MNATNARKLVDSKTLELLAWVLGETTLEIKEPSTNKKRAEKVQATITSPLARRAYSAYVALMEEAARLSEEHLEMHFSDEGSEHDCAEFRRKSVGLKMRADFLFSLFNVAVRQEHPATLAEDGTMIRAGWTLVTNEDVQWEPLPSDLKLVKFLVPLAEIVDGKPLTFSMELNPKVPEGAVEVAVLDDARIRSLVALLGRITSESRAGMPDKSVTDDPVRQREWMNTQTVGFLKCLNAQNAFVDLVAHTLSQVVNAAIWDRYPELGLQCFGLFDGWKVMTFPTPVIKRFMVDGEILDPESDLAKSLESLVDTLGSVSRGVGKKTGSQTGN
jgi:hypothetical protein